MKLVSQSARGWIKVVLQAVLPLGSQLQTKHSRNTWFQAKLTQKLTLNSFMQTEVITYFSVSTDEFTGFQKNTMLSKYGCCWPFLLCCCVLSVFWAISCLPKAIWWGTEWRHASKWKAHSLAMVLASRCEIRFQSLLYLLQYWKLCPDRWQNPLQQSTGSDFLP